MINLIRALFIINLVALFILLAGICWSVVRPEKRIWPPPAKTSWQYRVAWFLYYLVFGINTALLILDWNSWLFLSSLRFLIGVPLILIGTGLLLWSIKTLGLINTSGLAEGFIKAGPYRFTRNPQYLADRLLFIGLSILANSAYLWITHTLLILVFGITPLAEEAWLQETYGEPYQTYLEGTSRFL